MHASYVALLALAASTAAPVFAAPLPYIASFSAVMTPLTLRVSTVISTRALRMVALP